MIEGGCFCGAIRYEIDDGEYLAANCHCTMCQRGHGAGFVTWFVVPRSRFLLRKDDTLVRYASSDHGVRSFCNRCGSSLFCESTKHPDEMIRRRHRDHLDQRRRQLDAAEHVEEHDQR